ncbi:MAG: hypothetical protein ACHQJ6_03185 [Candidatus Berkiellales bacterium]
MKTFLPNELNAPWTYNFFSLKYKRFNSEVVVNHTTAIQRICQQNSTPLLAQLNDSLFWDNLNSSSGYQPKAQELQTLWEKIGPLAHLNTKELLELLEKHILPLERGYQYFLKEKHQKNIVSQVQDNFARLQSLKHLVFEGLYSRTQAYRHLKAPRNVDDMVAAICQQINDVDALAQPLPIPQPFSATLNDDRRLTCYFILRNAGGNARSLQRDILSSLPGVGHEALYSQDNIQAELDDADQFTQTVLNELNMGSTGENLFALTSQKHFTSSLFKSIARGVQQKIKDKVNATLLSLSQSTWLVNLQRLQYILFFIFSFVTYFFIVQLLQPVAFLLMSTATLAAVTNVLFYTIGIAPLWYLGFKWLEKTIETVRDYLVCWKKQEILDSIVTVERTQFLISNKLSQVVVDIPRFDIEELEQEVERCNEQIAKTQQALNRFSPGERFLCQGAILSQIAAIQTRLELKQQQVQTRLLKLTQHIAARVGEEIQLLQPSDTGDEPAPVLPQQQMEKLERFVKKYGSDETKRLFEHNTNVTELWLTQLETNRLSQNIAHAELDGPWGEYDLNERYLKGWEPILEAFTKDPKQRNAALKLNQLFLGKLQLTEFQLNKLVYELSLSSDEQCSQFVEKIRSYLFKTLHARAPQNACLLSTQDKFKIEQWRLDHQEQIEEAEKAMKKIFRRTPTLDDLKGIDNKKLERYYRLLDGADIHSYATGQMRSLDERQNLVRKYFENYSGENSIAYLLTRFVPKHELKELLPQIAQKRIHWIMDHLDEVDPRNPFDQRDRMLLHDHTLSDEFDFQACVAASPVLTQPWQRNVALFLNACPTAGFSTDQVSARYQALHQAEQLITAIRARAEPAPDVAPEVTPEALAVDSRKPINVTC